ncbi:MAG TPA: pyridoxal phosphate-dependent aminotransferase [Gemmatimonadaceae bacterium]|jgi:aspartate/methionine/tyrosine aminotransferase|nr:pyridoxal phosphate-dependent aminotransferase [Gemmatimonadaceae bacterium]
MTDTLHFAAGAALDEVPPLAARVDQLSGEGALDVFRRATELERTGRSIVHLELGAPDVDAPAHAVDAAVAALRAGDARYVAPQGLPELREAIATDVRSRGVDADADQVIVTPSAKTAVFYALLATVEPGSEVLVPDPGFPIYPSMARFTGGTPVGYALDADNAPDVDDIERRITARTRVLCLNSPNNPTGGALDAAAMARLAELVARHDLRVVTDDIYSRLVFEGDRAPAMAAFDGARSRTLLVDGFSKTYAMTGYRLGYLVVPRPWVEPLVTMAVNGHTCVPPFVQRAGIAALTGPQDMVTAQIAAYRERRDVLVRGLNALPGVKCPLPGGAFYVFPDFSALLTERGITSRTFAKRLLEEHGVAVIDGAAFGHRGEGCVRISFASARADLDAAVTRIGEAVAELAG